MKYKIAVSTSSFAAQDKAPLKLMEDAGLNVSLNPFGRRLTEEEITTYLKGVDGLIAGLEPLSRQVLSSHPQLKVIARVGIGMDNIDLEAARELGIKVSNTPDEPAAAVAEMTLTALLSLCREIYPANSALHKGNWRKFIGAGLTGTKVLIIGYGRIGQQVARLLRALGAKILVTDPLIQKKELKKGDRKVNLNDGLKIADVISLHASGKKQILGKAELSKIKDGVIILNSARAELVNEDALIAALKLGKIANAWFDVFWEEPYQGRLIKFENVLLTPHMGTYTKQCRRGMEIAAVKNLLRDLNIIFEQAD
jgi:D-3-phosphoglycerate dehydrogenase / 2-oxoglutarate reductase